MHYLGDLHLISGTPGAPGRATPRLGDDLCIRIGRVEFFFSRVPGMAPGKLVRWTVEKMWKKCVDKLDDKLIH
jgi:hypothetical protein